MLSHLTLFFFVSLWILGTCIKHFGSKLIPAATIDIFDRMVSVNNRGLDAREEYVLKEGYRYMPLKVFSLASDPVFTRNFYVLSGRT